MDGLAPRDRHQAEEPDAQPALDRRHRHRDLRLHAPALRGAAAPSPACTAAASSAGTRSTRSSPRCSRWVNRMRSRPPASMLSSRSSAPPSSSSRCRSPRTPLRENPPPPSRPNPRSAPPGPNRPPRPRPAFNLADSLRERLTELRGRGYNRLYQPAADSSLGRIVEFSTPESLLELDFAAIEVRPIFVLIDRLALSPGIRSRLVDAIETGYREAGEIQFHVLPRSSQPVTEPVAPSSPAASSPDRVGSAAGDTSGHLRFSAAFECTTCHRAYREPEPRLFSFNNPYGACPRCQGFGNTIDFDPDLIIPDKSRSLDKRRDRSVGRRQVPSHAWRTETFLQVRRHTSTDRQALVRPHRRAAAPHPGRPTQRHSGPYPGVRGFFADLDRKKYKLHVRVFLSKYRGYATCPDCRGQRLRAEARAVLLKQQEHMRGRRPHHHRGQSEFFDNLRTLARHRPRSPARSSKRSASASAFSIRSDSTI